MTSLHTTPILLIPTQTEGKIMQELDLTLSGEEATFQCFGEPHDCIILGAYGAILWVTTDFGITLTGTAGDFTLV